MREEWLRDEIVRAGRLLYERGLIVAGDGNLSARLADGAILATPAGACKGMLAPEELVVVDLDGNPLREAQRPVSSEFRLHAGIYRDRPDVRAVAHAHPPVAVAATLAGVRLDEPLLPEAIIALGAVPTAPYALTGTDALYAAVAPFVVGHSAILLSHHGAVTLGDAPLECFFHMEQVEHIAKIVLAARQFGGARPLPPERYEELERRFGGAR